MQIRTALVACVLVLGTLAAITSASAGDNYSGFGPSAGTETQEIGSSPDNEVAPLDNGETLPWLQPQSQHQQDVYSVEGEQPAASEEYDMDDEGGH